MPDNSLYHNLKKNEQRRKRKSGLSSLILFYIIPFILINSVIFYAATALPKVNITISEPINDKSVEIYIKKTSIFPSKEISALFENEELSLEKVDHNTYRALVEKNGNLEVRISNINGMSKTFYEYVAAIDDTPPTIDGSVGEDDLVYVSFLDEGSGIDFDSIFAIDFNGNRQKALSLDEENYSATFAYDNLSLEVHVSDKAGNEVIANFSNVSE